VCTGCSERHQQLATPTLASERPERIDRRWPNRRSKDAPGVSWVRRITTPNSEMILANEPSMLARRVPGCLIAVIVRLEKARP
jgi:hypothetical protein